MRADVVADGRADRGRGHWWLGWGSDPRPRGYESRALPLSYPAMSVDSKVRVGAAQRQGALETPLRSTGLCADCTNDMPEGCYLSSLSRRGLGARGDPAAMDRSRRSRRRSSSRAAATISTRPSCALRALQVSGPAGGHRLPGAHRDARGGIARNTPQVVPYDARSTPACLPHARPDVAGAN